MPQRETSIAKPALHLLEEMGFDVYQEVGFGWGGSRADIVGIKKGVVCVVEVKAALTFEVIAQAKEWIRYAHWRFIAVPGQVRGGTSAGRRLALDLCEQMGIGVIEIGKSALNYTTAKIRAYPALNRAAESDRLIAALRPEHKTFAPAGSSGKFWSPWRESVERLIKDVKARPGRTLKEVVAEVPHHWSSNTSAKSCIARQIHVGIIKGLELRPDGRELRVYPESA